MKRIKRIISTIMTLFLIFQLNTIESFAMTSDQYFSESKLTSALLSDDYFYELTNTYSNVISVEKIYLDGDVLENCVYAFSNENNDDTIPIECSGTLRKITYYDINCQTLNEGRYTNSTAYILEGSTKVSSDDVSSHGVYLYGYMTWIDNLGTQNEFIDAGGYRTGSYTGDGHYSITRYGVGLGGGDFSTSFYTTGNSNDHTGLQFHLLITSKASDGNNVQLSITNSFLD